MLVINRSIIVVRVKCRKRFARIKKTKFLTKHLFCDIVFGNYRNARMTCMRL